MKKKIYYANVIYDEALCKNVTPGRTLIGLFSECQHEGRGTFCGWHAREFYIDTTLYAHYEIEDGLYSPEKRVSDVVVLDPPVYYDEVQIGSCYWTRPIEATTVEDAIKKFSKAEWADR